MSKRIIGVTVGTPISTAKIKNDIAPEIKAYVDEQMGDVEAALDRIIEIQETLMGGVITFTVIGNTLNAEKGMTWSEFVESEYNIYGYYIQGNYVACGTHSGIFVTDEDEDYSFVSPNDVIRSGAKYNHG